jgi:hypothetical protein
LDLTVTFISELPWAINGLTVKECGEIGVNRIAFRCGSTIAPPLESE